MCYSINVKINKEIYAVNGQIYRQKFVVKLQTVDDKSIFI